MHLGELKESIVSDTSALSHRTRREISTGFMLGVGPSLSVESGTWLSEGSGDDDNDDDNDNNGDDDDERLSASHCIHVLIQQVTSSP